VNYIKYITLLRIDQLEQETKKDNAGARRAKSLAEKEREREAR
jgi:hypothetical protein